MSKLKVTRAKEREHARQRRYHADDILQPFDEKGRRSAKFERIYGHKIKKYYDGYKGV